MENPPFLPGLLDRVHRLERDLFPALALGPALDLLDEHAAHHVGGARDALPGLGLPGEGLLGGA